MSEAEDVRGLWPLKSCFTAGVIKVLRGATLSMGAQSHQNATHPLWLPERFCFLAQLFCLSVCVCPRHYRLRIQWVSGWFLHEAARTEQNKLWRCWSVKLFVAVQIFHVFILFAALAYNPRRPLSSKNSQSQTAVNLFVFIFFLSFFIFDNLVTFGNCFFSF